MRAWTLRIWTSSRVRTPSLSYWLVVRNIDCQGILILHDTDRNSSTMSFSTAPCKASCTVEQLESYCLALSNCVAFNTHGWLKYSTADMAPDSCNLYVKKDIPQPSPTPSPSPPPPPKIWFWPLPISVNAGAGNVTGACLAECHSDVAL
jgi:hypothetical protein